MPETPIEHFGYTKNEWKQKDFNEIITNLPDKLKVVYDIGANAGGFTQVLGEIYGTDKVKYYCFEPAKNICDSLVEFIPFATAINKGVYYGKKTSKAMWRGSNIGAVFLEEINSGEPRMFTGETFELCELEELGLEKPTLIKMDVEGAEENILEFSEICKNCPYLIIEWHPDNNPREFFAKHLPKHKVVVSLIDRQFLLKI